MTRNRCHKMACSIISFRQACATRPLRRAFPILLVTGPMLTAWMALSCGPNSGETPTSGSLVVYGAESVSPAIKDIVDEFNKLYTNAHISLVVCSSREAIVKLLNNEAKVVVSARALNAEEVGVVTKYELYVDSIKIAYDGIAAIVHPSNPVNQLSLNELNEILTGKIKRWRDLPAKGKSTPEIIVALGGPNTSEYELMKTDVANGKPFTTRLYPCSTSTEVIQLIASRPEAIGFVGVGWLANDSSKVKVLELGTDEYFTDSAGRQVKYFAPEQAHIYRGFYPLRRAIYIYSREKGFGLGAGFMTYVASPDGQTIMKNHGLVPATQKVRLVRPSSETS
jgi:phosphate transport system substrate-binding protein